MNTYIAPSARPIYKSAQVVWYLLSLLEAILILRFLLRLFGANPAASFTSLVYQISRPFVLPFQSVFRITSVEGAVVEWTTLLAMLVYWGIAVAIIRLFFLGTNNTIYSKERDIWE